MDWCRPGSAGSDYTVQDSFVHLLMQLAGSAGLALAGAVGYSAVLAAATVLGLAGVGAAAWLFRQPDPGGITGARPGGHDDGGPEADRQLRGGAHAR
jgi:hypothetical protein